ncbi:MAG TPA: hypothetical protein VII94_00490 [Candidatus Saccharimonadales bacterium]
MNEQNHFTLENHGTTSEQPVPAVADSITWTASEFIDNAKSFEWYLFFFIGIFIICFLIYLFTHSIFSAIIIFILGVALCYMATRRPKELSYKLDNKGLIISNTNYPFTDFKSYSIVSEDGLDHISLTPVKRFTPNRTIYFDPRDKDHIISLLGEFLPLEAISNDPIDKFMKKIGL